MDAPEKDSAGLARDAEFVAAGEIAIEPAPHGPILAKAALVGHPTTSPLANLMPSPRDFTTYLVLSSEDRYFLRNRPFNV